MGIKANFNTTDRLIELLEAPVGGVATIDFRVDIYSDAKEDWRINAGGERLHRFPFVTAETAGDVLPGGKEEPIFYRLRNGLENWRILPFDADHDLTITGMAFPIEPLNRMIAPRAGRTILVILDGSQVAGLSVNGVAQGVDAAPSQIQIQDVVEADQVKVGGQLQYRRRGTVTQLIPAKDVTGDQAPASVSIVEP
jgi:hypothetical protein